MDALEKQLVCPICLEMFSKPVVILPCQHNLCRKCASDVFQASNPYLSARSSSALTFGRTDSFRCPSCRHEVVLDRHGVYGLQRNLLVENIIDMYKQGSSSSRPEAEVKQQQPMCGDHEEEKINIYCVSCSAPTCSLCKVFGAHKDCEVAPLESVFQAQKAELTDCVSLLVGNNERVQAIISQLEETCRVVNENGCRQKSKVCEAFDRLFALLEDRKCDMIVQINAEQEEKLDYIRGLSKRHGEHLESSAKLLESAIQTLDQPEMALFLQVTKPLLQKLLQGADTSHLEQVQHGYEKMDHFRANVEGQRRALMRVDFLRLDDEDEEEAADIKGTAAGSPFEEQRQAEASTNQQPDLQRGPEDSPTPQSAPPPSPRSTAPQAPPTPAASASQSDQQREPEDADGPKHVFSFSWLNQKRDQ